MASSAQSEAQCDIGVVDDASTPQISGDAVSFALGDRFESFDGLQSLIKKYEQANFMQFWKRDARTVDAAKKRLDRPLNPALKYYEVKFCCIHGGQTFRSSGKGIRTTSTFKQDCPVHVAFRASADGNALEVRSVNLSHNHEVSQELFRHLPQQRQLSKEAKDKAAALLKMKANKKMIQQQLTQETGNVVLLKDLTNIALLEKRGKTRNDLDKSVTLLMEKYGCTVEVYSDEKKNFKGLFFQDDLMKQAFQAYPEILFMDATYKLLELGLPTYLFLSEDSNGQSEITGVCLLTSEDADSMKWMIEVFKRCNDEWRNTRVVMADKDIQERDVIKQCLPESSVMICLFHTLRSFRREISCEKMGISAGQRTLSLEIVQKLAYASSEAEYDELYSQLKQDAPSEVVQYFDLNWHPIRKEWVLGLKSACGSFLNATNNRLESINGKLKQVINRNSSLEDFISSFFTILTALRTERDHKAAVMFQKVKVVPYDQGSPESEYSKLLTSYASSFVIKQIQLAPKVKGIKSVGDQYVVDTSEGNKVVSLTDCYCVFRKSMLLPCRHMLALRIMLKEPVFDSTICEKRWTSAYYRSTQRLFSTHSSQPSLSVMESAKQKRKLSQHEKYRKALLLTSELASVASGASHIHFHRRIKLLQELIDHWKGGREVGLVDLNEASEDLQDDSSEEDSQSDVAMSRPGGIQRKPIGIKKAGTNSQQKDTQKKLSDSNVIQLESHGKCTKTKNTSDIFAQKSPSNVQAPEKQKTDKSGIHTQSTNSQNEDSLSDCDVIQPDGKCTNSCEVKSPGTVPLPEKQTVGENAQCSKSGDQSTKNGVQSGNDDESCSGKPVQLGLKVPPAIKKRGRPKGHELTTIGLPTKKSRTNSGGPRAFIRLHTSEKMKVILEWFVDKAVAEAAMKGNLVDEESIECRPERISHAVLDENVDVHLVRKCFSQDAWMTVEDVLKQKRSNPIWTCTMCNHDLHREPSIICESCLEWYHFRCVGLSGQPKKKNWFCRSCC